MSKPLGGFAFLRSPNYPSYSSSPSSTTTIPISSTNHIWIILAFVVAVICVITILYFSYHKIPWSIKTTNQLVIGTPTFAPIVTYSPVTATPSLVTPINNDSTPSSKVVSPILPS